jgi:CRISPR-associated protein Csm1
LEEERRKEIQEALIGWGVGALGRWAGIAPRACPAAIPETASKWLSTYGKLLSSAWNLKDSKGNELLSIFSLIQAGEAHVEQVFVPARPLSLENLLADDEAHAISPQHLWQEFVAEFERLPAGSDRFDVFAYLFQKYAWSVPCTYDEAGVSLYEEFKALAALVHASDGAEEPAEKLLLVGGDIPGIQSFVYTITSKGAAKGLRGRSFFLQILGDAVVRRLVTDLGLCQGNVVYAAGGNFMVLAPSGAETLDLLRKIRRRINEFMLEAFQGDMTLVLETVEAKPAELFKAEQFKPLREMLGRRVAQAKYQPLVDLAADWNTVFEPRGAGSDKACVVCRVEVDESNSKLQEPTGEVPEGAESSSICYLCDSFRELAEEIRHRGLWLAINEQADVMGTASQTGDGWRDLLTRMTGFEYRFYDSCPATGGTKLIVNRTDFFQMGTFGFNLIANVTPMVEPDDLAYLEEIDPEGKHKAGDIRSFALMAHAASDAGAIERVGVLRMDVDGLGYTFSEWVPTLTMPRLSALSCALDRFFNGYLNLLVRKYGGNDLYIIYAGGDDLFIVGAWHHLPKLAEGIHEAFKAYTGRHPAWSLSGGMTLEGAKFPLYRAAERAGEAEHKAKGYVRQVDEHEHRKDAFCLLGEVVGWEKEEWDVVRNQKDSLLWLVGGNGGGESKRGLSRALLHLLQDIHQLYSTGLRDARRRARKNKEALPNARMYLGRWAWMQAYSLTRMVRRSNDAEAKERLRRLQEAVLRPETVRFSGLAARWAEYLIRKEK